MREMCWGCFHWQEDEPEAGLRAGCVADEIYKDEDCQEFDEENYSIMEAYMADEIEICPFFQNGWRAAGMGWTTEFMRVLTDAELEKIRTGGVTAAKKIIGQVEGLRLGGVGDTHRRFEGEPKLVQNGLYKASNGKTTVFYAVAVVVDAELAFCYSIY